MKKYPEQVSKLSLPWKPALLAPLLETTASGLSLEQRLTLAFLETDMEFFQQHPKEEDSFTGTTASVLVVDADIQSFFSPESDLGKNNTITITTAHAGDTR
jgi:hypothetical protein